VNSPSLESILPVNSLANKLMVINLSMLSNSDLNHYSIRQHVILCFTSNKYTTKNYILYALNEVNKFRYMFHTKIFTHLLFTKCSCTETETRRHFSKTQLLLLLLEHINFVTCTQKNGTNNFQLNSFPIDYTFQFNINTN